MITAEQAGRVAILESAVDILETKGWYQGGLHAEDGRSCILGALSWAWLKQVQAARLWDVLTDVARTLGYDPETVGRGWRGWLASWNDTAGRTAAEVVGVLRQTADRLRATNQGELK